MHWHIHKKKVTPQSHVKVRNKIISVLMRASERTISFSIFTSAAAVVFVTLNAAAAAIVVIFILEISINCIVHKRQSKCSQLMKRSPKKYRKLNKNNMQKYEEEGKKT